MNDEQVSRLADSPVLYRPVIKRAYQGKSKAAGIKAFCLQCVGYVRDDITGCTALGCPLWPYRPYQKGADDEHEDVEPGATPA